MRHHKRAAESRISSGHFLDYLMGRWLIVARKTIGWPGRRVTTALSVARGQAGVRADFPTDLRVTALTAVAESARGLLLQVDHR
jgi:hypothetical protein